jgi:TonB family protein
VELISSEPVRPDGFVAPRYPPIARAAHIEGTVAFTVEVDSEGHTANVSIISGHPMLRGVVQKAVADWKFSKEMASQKINAAIDFKLNCPPR